MVVFGKQFWLSCLFICVLIYGTGKGLLGLKQSPKINFDRYDYGDVIGGTILSIIAAGWLFDV